MNLTWPEYLMGFAEHAARKSKDSTQVGAALTTPEGSVLITAYNGPPRCRISGCAMVAICCRRAAKSKGPLGRFKNLRRAERFVQAAKSYFNLA